MKPLVLPPHYSSRIVNISYLMLVSLATSLFRTLYLCSLCTLAVFITSQLYWRHPTKGRRRLLDMIISASSLLYHIMLATFYVPNPASQIAYFGAVLIGVGCYLIARHLKCKDMSSRLHCLLHIFGNVSNVILYNSLACY